MLNKAAKQTLDDIKLSAEVVNNLLRDYSESGIFNFFQLRPNGNKKIEIVSFLPHSPMRGIECGFNGIRHALDKIVSKLKEQDGAPPAGKDLEEWGFESRSTPAKTYREDDVQAAFCLHMLRADSQFDEISLVATEFLMAMENERIDVLGVKGSTLYIFELKRDRKNSAYKQAQRYKEELVGNIGDYLELLRYYQNIDKNIASFSVAAVTVMPWDKNHKLNKPDDMEHWLFEIPTDYDFSNGIVFLEKNRLIFISPIYRP